MKPITVAVDGPAGSGKSTVAKELARAAGLTYVDSGAIYRAISWCALAAGLPPEDPRVPRLVDDRAIALSGEGERFAVTIGGRACGDEIRTPEVSRAVALYSAAPAVRDRVNRLLRDFSVGRSIVMDGRDIGTVVLPHAGLKVFLTAQPVVRARRRLLELESRGERATLEEVLADVVERDRRDETRAVAPLAKAPDAVEIDTSGMGRDEVIAALARLTEERRA